MNVFPQIGGGAVAQFPIRRTRLWRSISNTLESGEQIILPDTAAAQIEWELSYKELSDSEAAALSNLFASAEGSFGAFLFIDPLANLFGWSEDFSRPDWSSELLLSTPGSADPVGTQRASTVSNASAGAQLLSQTLAIPGDYVACFSAYVRASGPGSIALQRDGRQVVSAVGSQWKRVFISGTGTAGASESTFSVALNAGQNVDIWGLQVEAQPFPSVYRPTTNATGIFEETYFGMDELTMISTGVGLSASNIKLLSRI